MSRNRGKTQDKIQYIRERKQKKKIQQKIHNVRDNNRSNIQEKNRFNQLKEKNLMSMHHPL